MGRPREGRLGDGHASPSRRSTWPASRASGEIEADDKQAVAAQLRNKGLIVLDIEEQKPANAGDLLARFKRVKADELTVATRQLSTMVSLGHVAAARALRDRGADRQRQAARGLGRGAQGRRGRHRSLSEALGSTPTSSTSSTWRWWPPARPAASWRRPCCGSPTSSRRTTRCGARSRRRWSTRRSSAGSRMVVLLALVAFLVPVFEKVFKDFGGELPLITKFTVAMSHMVTGRWYLMIVIVVALVYAFRRWKNSDKRADAVGPVQAQGPVEDRRHRAEGRAGALLADLLGPDLRRRADARGDRDHRPHVRQQGGRAGDGAGPRLGQARRHDLPSRCARCPRPSR